MPMNTLKLTVVALGAFALSACGDSVCDQADDCCNAVAALFAADPDTTVTCEPIPDSATDDQCQASIDLQSALVSAGGMSVPSECE